MRFRGTAFALALFGVALPAAAQNPRPAAQLLGAPLPLSLNLGGGQANNRQGAAVTDLFGAVQNGVNALANSRAAPNGIATLDATGKVPIAQLPGQPLTTLIAPGDFSVLGTLSALASGPGPAIRSLSDRAGDFPSVLEWRLPSDAGDDAPMIQRALNAGYPAINMAGNWTIKSPIVVSAGAVRAVDGRFTITCDCDAFRITQDNVRFFDATFTHRGSGRVLFYDGSNAGGGDRIHISTLSGAKKSGSLIYYRGSYFKFNDLSIDNFRVGYYAVDADSMAGALSIENRFPRLYINGTGRGILVHSSDRSKRPEGLTLVDPTLLNQDIQVELQSILDFNIDGGTLDQAGVASIYLNPVTTAQVGGGAYAENGLEQIGIRPDWISATSNGSTSGRGTGILVNGAASGSVVNLSVAANITTSQDGITLAPNVDGVNIESKTQFNHLGGVALTTNGAVRVTLIGPAFRDVAANVNLSGAGPFTSVGTRWDQNGLFYYAPSNKDGFSFTGDTGLRTSGWASAVSGSTVGLSDSNNAGSTYVLVPLALVKSANPGKIMLGAPQVVTGAFSGVTAQVVAVDPINVTVQVFWTQRVTDGTFRVTLFGSI